MEQGLLLPRGAAPIRFRRLLLLWLYQQSFLRGWQSDIVLQPDEERPSFPAVLGAAQASSLLLLCLRPEDYQLLRCCNRELYGVFETIAALVRRAAPRLRQAYLA